MSPRSQEQAFIEEETHQSHLHHILKDSPEKTSSSSNPYNLALKPFWWCCACSSFQDLTRSRTWTSYSEDICKSSSSSSSSGFKRLKRKKEICRHKCCAECWDVDLVYNPKTEMLEISEWKGPCGRGGDFVVREWMVPMR